MHYRLWALGVAFALALASSCHDEVGGSGTAPPTTTTGGSGGAADAGSDAGADAPADALPPAKPTGNLVVWRLHLGDPSEDPDSPPAEQLGMDLDGKDSKITSPDHCTLYPGAKPSDVKLDGEDGIDNSLARNIVPLVKGPAPTFATDVNKAIWPDGGTTLLFRTSLPELLRDGYVQTYIYRTLALPAPPPLLDGSDVFPIDQACLLGACGAGGAGPDGGSALSLDDALFHDPAAALAGDVLAIELPRLRLRLTAGDYPLAMTIRHARIEMTLSDDRSRALQGTIAGVVPIEEALRDVQTMLLHSPLKVPCGSSVVDDAIEKAQDIHYDKDKDIISNDAGEDCNAISVGIGFEAVAALYGEPQPDPNPLASCPGPEPVEPCDD
ncbi:MAG: hypothetical protein HY744_04020 [Deltaproteobacteria bacterium]|nr:hypothetical protein [Deltaproteobacteria bacterium]